ncbi:hypothetical protein TNCV_4433471 [Trichonephila clavipes]|nr:hypothetical protein TNCV_4433471 [Trichonephila clavipes]
MADLGFHLDLESLRPECNNRSGIVKGKRWPSTHLATDFSRVTNSLSSLPLNDFLSAEILILMIYFQIVSALFRNQSL